MLSFLKCQPFAVEAFFESSLVFTYAVPVSELKNLIPPCLELDTLNNEYGFVAVAVVKTKGLRPKGFPKIIGNDFILVGYRIFVKYTTSAGKKLRGLYILRSETDKRKMVFMGNIFTGYNYSLQNISYVQKNEAIQVLNQASGFNVTVDLKMENPSLPENSPFKDWKEARRFAGPLPFTFSYNSQKKKVLIVEGIREHWQPKPVNVVKSKISYLDQMNFNKINLANAFFVENISYHWRKGRFDTWKE